MKRIILASLLLLAACKGNTAKDGYYFEDKQFTSHTMTVKVMEHPDMKSLRAMYDSEKSAKPVVGDNRILKAYSVISFDQNGNETCKMHIIDPAKAYEPEFIGHEFTHCVYGEFHKNQ